MKAILVHIQETIIIKVTYYTSISLLYLRFDGILLTSRTSINFTYLFTIKAHQLTRPIAPGDCTLVYSKDDISTALAHETKRLDGEICKPYANNVA